MNLKKFLAWVAILTLLILFWGGLANCLFGQTLYNMAGLAQADRKVFSTPFVAPTLVDAATIGNATDHNAILAAVDSLEIHSAVSSFNWSGLSACTWRGSRTSGDGTVSPAVVTASLPVVMITATHGLASDHNGPNVGEYVYFRTPAGGATHGVVAQKTTIRSSHDDLRLIRFTANPGATLKRYSVMSNAADYTNNMAWWPNQDLTLRIRQFSGEYDGTDVAWQQWWTGPWNDYINSGSGRPALIALSDGNLVIAGTLWMSHQTTSPYINRSYVNTEMAAATEPDEVLTTTAVPIDTPPAEDPDYLLTFKPRVFNGVVFGRGN